MVRAQAQWEAPVLVLAVPAATCPPLRRVLVCNERWPTSSNLFVKQSWEALC